MPQSPFLAAPALWGHARHSPAAQGGSWHGAERAGDWAKIPSPISDTGHFSVAFFPSQTCTVVSVGPTRSSRAAAPSCCRCSAVPVPPARLLCRDGSFLAPPRAGRQGSASPPLPPALPSPSPSRRAARSHRPRPLRPRPPAARGGGVSPLGRFSSARHVWVLCPAPTSSPHASSR